MNPLSTVGVWRTCKRALGIAAVPDGELDESARREVEKVTWRKIAADAPQCLPPVADCIATPPLQVICWFCVSEGKRNLAFYEGQAEDSRRPEGRYVYRCYFCGNSSSLYADDFAVYLADIAAVMRGEKRFEEALSSAHTKNEGRPRCAACGGAVMVEYGFEELCESCAVTEYLNDVWAEGENEEGEFEGIVRAANAVALKWGKRTDGATLKYKHGTATTGESGRASECEALGAGKEVLADALPQLPEAQKTTSKGAGWLRRSLGLVERGLDVSSEFIAKALIFAAKVLEVTFDAVGVLFAVVGELLGKLLVVVFLISFVIGLVWLVKWLWVHLPA